MSFEMNVIELQVHKLLIAMLACKLLLKNYQLVSPNTENIEITSPQVIFSKATLLKLNLRSVS